MKKRNVMNRREFAALMLGLVLGGAVAAWLVPKGSLAYYARVARELRDCQAREDARR